MYGKYSWPVVDRKPQLIHPVGLCVDTDQQRLYWYDYEYRSISTSKYDGSDTRFYSLRLSSSVNEYDRFIVNLEVYKVSSHHYSGTNTHKVGPLWGSDKYIWAKLKVVYVRSNLDPFNSKKMPRREPPVQYDCSEAAYSLK